MKMSVHLNFKGNCAAAFAFYAKVFRDDNPFGITYAEAPGDGMPIPAEWKNKVMHASILLGDGRLMGCDAPPDHSVPMGGFQVSVEANDEAEVRRIYEELSTGGSVQMLLMQTFWSPLFGMCTDKYGVAWMVSVPGASPQ